MFVVYDLIKYFQVAQKFVKKSKFAFGCFRAAMTIYNILSSDMEKWFKNTVIQLPNLINLIINYS
jgi:hypothetical protein